MRDEPIVFIAREGEHTNLLYHALAGAFRVHLILEEPPTRYRLIRSRIRRLGIWRVTGQALFQLLVAVPLGRLSSARRETIIKEAGLDARTPGPGSSITRTPSVNSSDCLEQVRKLNPKVIVINGTRILKQSTLDAFGVPVINVHAGITPQYRGVHGGYWALANNDPEHCGVTVHLVDAGIDTGDILAQAHIQPGPEDNFATYPTLQMCEAAPLLVQAVQSAINGTTTPRKGAGASHRWEHPTITQYLWVRFKTGVK